MPPTFEKALKNPESKKLVFARYKLRMELFGWIAADSAYPNIWYTLVSDISDVLSVDESETTAVEVASLAALNAQDTSTVGAFFWDTLNNIIYVKPLDDSGTDIYSYLYIAIVLLAYSRHGDVHDSLPHAATVSRVPSASLRTSEVFDGKLAQVGGGNISMENSESLFVRNDVEIDGILEMVAALETMGGV